MSYGFVDEWLGGHVSHEIHYYNASGLRCQSEIFEKSLIPV
jgi:hypothetical protein